MSAIANDPVGTALKALAFDQGQRNDRRAFAELRQRCGATSHCRRAHRENYLRPRENIRKTI